MSARRVRRPRPAEGLLLEAVARELEARGYRTYLDPDGSDYFDLAARRGDEVGLVEGKVGRPAAVLGQALRRRPWADWVAVVLDSPIAGSRLADRTSRLRSSFVGVWSYADGVLREHRVPTPHSADPPEPFAATRAAMRRRLDAIDSGAVPRGVRWSGIVADVRRASAGRGFAEWRLDEPERDSA